MCDMSVTAEVSQWSGWLKAHAPWSRRDILVTDEVSQPSGWLKLVAD